MTKKHSRMIAALMLVIAVVFISIALSNPQAGFPWSNIITHTLYGISVSYTHLTLPTKRIV